ncbi:MAG: hypothetical protein HKM93_22770 [Desulfobacteraceae bacterium]|nr:hypothetical protein [Desulfobacteraceae bacterium]
MGISKKVIVRWMAILFSLFTFIGCGGSGGGSSSGGDGLSYTGRTDPALITEANSHDLALTAYTSGEFAGSLGSFAGLEAESSVNGPGRPLLLHVWLALHDSMAQVDSAAAAGQSSVSAVQTESQTVPGDCPGAPGEARYTITADDVTGVFSGSIQYSAYCVDDTTLNGEAGFTGVLDTDAGEFVSFRFTFDNLTSNSGFGSVTLDGSMEMAVSGETVTISMSLLVDNEGETFRIDDYQIAAEDFITYSVVSFSGRFYHPDEGYITLSTGAPLYINHSDIYPYDGVLLFTGADGSADGPTRIRLTAVSDTTCRVEADTNGDGTYDYDSGEMPWEDL